MNVGAKIFDGATIEEKIGIMKLLWEAMVEDAIFVESGFIWQEWAIKEEESQEAFYAEWESVAQSIYGKYWGYGDVMERMVEQYHQGSFQDFQEFSDELLQAYSELFDKYLREDGLKFVVHFREWYKLLAIASLAKEKNDNGYYEEAGWATFWEGVDACRNEDGDYFIRKWLMAWRNNEMEWPDVYEGLDSRRNTIYSLLEALDPDLLYEFYPKSGTPDDTETPEDTTPDKIYDFFARFLPAGIAKVFTWIVKYLFFGWLWGRWL